MAAISVHEEDWANAVAYAEKARILLRDLEGERGISMPM
jgi:superkiller protein 3